MRVVPLYPEPPRAAVELVAPAGLNPKCALCRFGERNPRTVCMSADWQPFGQTGGLLVVCDHPGKDEDITGRPLIGGTGRYLRKFMASVWKGAITYDNAVRCFPGADRESEKPISMCRSYLAGVIQEVKPSKILAMGSWAVQAITGRVLPVMSVRRGYSWIVGPPAIPVYYFPNPIVATQNRFLREHLESDITWALKDFRLTPKWDGKAKVITTLDDALEAERELMAVRWFGYDSETAGKMFGEFQMVCCACSAAGSEDAFVWDVEAMWNQPIRDVLARLMSNPKATKVGSNMKYDQNSTLLELGKHVEGVVGDTRLLRRTLDADADGDLETMAELVGCGGHKEEAQDALVQACRRVVALGRENVGQNLSLFSSNRVSGLRESVVKEIRPGDNTKQYAYGLLPTDIRVRYVARDAVTTSKLNTRLETWLSEDDPKVARTYRNIVLPAADALRQVEEWGVWVDQTNIQAFHTMLVLRKNGLMDRLQKYGSFNPDSTREIEDLLFVKLRLPPQKKTATGKSSTDVEALEAIKHLHPVVNDLLEWRSVTKLDGTFASGMMHHIRPDGRIHPSILPDGARSGRPSCQNPNLQTIPRDADSEEGKMARDCFAAPPGYVMMSADYNQLELRIAAMLSGDPVMIDIFRRGIDFHQATAEFMAPIVWGISPGEVKKPHRSKAKAFNFGILYGMGDHGIAERAACTMEEAGTIREAVLGKFSVLAAWIAERLAFARKHGYCWTWWNGEDCRRRPLTDIAEPGTENGDRRVRAEHSAHNTPVQGTGADFLTMSLIKTVEWIKDDDVPAKIVLPVHDSLLLEVREDAVEEVAYHVERIMTGWNSCNVPITVDIEQGLAWGSLVKRKKVG